MNAGEVFTAVQALIIQPLAAVALARLTATRVSVLGVYFISNAEKNQPGCKWYNNMGSSAIYLINIVEEPFVSINQNYIYHT